jgi:hypothetical protein
MDKKNYATNQHCRYFMICYRNRYDLWRYGNSKMEFA